MDTVFTEIVSACIAITPKLIQTRGAGALRRARLHLVLAGRGPHY
jgi:hypothetical protein